MKSSDKAPSKKDKDLLVLEALVRSGSNLSKPHEIDFWFDFDNEENATKVSQVLSNNGYKTEVRKNETSPEFSCKAIKVLVPELSIIQFLTAEFEELAEKHQGVYDGWGCEVVS